MPAAREEFGSLLSGEIGNAEIPRMRASTFAYNVTFIRVLAGCHHLWKRGHASWSPLAEFLRNAHIGHGSGHGLLVDAGLTTPDGSTLFARRQEVARAIDYIVKSAEADGEIKDPSTN